MTRAVFALITLLCTFCAAEDFPIVPASEDRPAPNSTTPNQLSFCIVYYDGEPTPWGRPTFFWISIRGHVFTQTIESRPEDNELKEIRHEYDLTATEFKQLEELLNVLRTDTRVLRERDLAPEETNPIIAFGMFPHSDLFVREKCLADHWKNFTAVTRYLSQIHSTKINNRKPSYTGDWKSGQRRWEPDGFPSLKVIDSLLYAGGDLYKTNLENLEKSEQPGAAQPATQPADKVLRKDQPSTPTPKDAPR